MTRILHVITGLNVGGAETMLCKLLSASSSAYEHCVVSLAPAGPVADRITSLGVPVYSLGLRAAAPSPVRIWKLRSLARRIRPDLIAGWMYHGNLMASFAGSAVPDARVLWGMRSSLSGLAHRRWRTAAVIWLGKRLSRQPDAIIYASHVARTQHEASGYYAGRSVVIPNGTDCTEFAPNESTRAEVRAELGLEDHSCVIGLVARRHPMKDHDGFLRAAAMVVRDEPTARFLLVGTGVTEGSTLSGLIQELGLKDRVLLLGERSDMPRITAALDIACSASAWGEAFSNAIGEAMACAVPCVVTDVGDSAYLLGDAGIVVPPSNTQAMANAIRRLISTGAAGRRQLGQKARRRIQENFSLPAVAARYEEFYGRHTPRQADGSLTPKMENLDPQSEPERLLTGRRQSR
jgi:glycosyltransferase involved in cell wall biosynthesis